MNLLFLNQKSLIFFNFYISNIITDLALGKRTRDMKENILESSSFNFDNIHKNSINLLHVNLPKKPTDILSSNENEMLCDSQNKDCLLKSSIILLPKEDDWGWYINTEKCLQ